MWNVKSTGQFSELYVELTETIDGQILVVESPKIFDWEIIPNAIDWANAHGWKNRETHPDMRIRFTRKGFIHVSND